MKRKAQAWGFDLMVAMVIFMSGIIIFYLYALNSPNQGQEIIEGLFFDGNFITDSLLSTGSPDNWDEASVIAMGLTNNNKINQTKLDRLYHMANPSTNPSGYAKTKALFNTKYNYFFNFTDTTMLIENTPVTEGGVGIYPSSTPKNLIKIQRITIYQNKPVTLDLYIWD